MNGTEERIAQDIKQAMHNPVALGIILQNSEDWAEQITLIKTGKYKQAMTSIENSIAQIEEYLAQSPRYKDALSFTLARAYGNKGLCIIMEASFTQNYDMAKRGIQWIDKALATTNWPQEAGDILRTTRDGVTNDIASKTSAKPKTQSFNEVSVICPTCGRPSTIEIYSKCKGACTYDMDAFESGDGLFCVVCGGGFYAKSINDKGEGVLHCGHRICRAPIPATPHCIKPEKKDCFIATATYGTPLAPEVKILREFRERNLRPTVSGQKFITFYEKCSPTFANWLVHQPLVRLAIRQLFLTPTIWLIKRTMKF